MGRTNLRKVKLFALMFLFIFIIGIVSSAPPVTTVSQFTEGIAIEYPTMDTFKVGTSYDFHFHIFNISNGKYFTSGVDCYMHIYNSSGNHIYKGFDNVVSNDFDYAFKPDGLTNFSTPGLYYFIVQCNTTGLGGYAKRAFEVSATGIELTSAKTTLYCLIWIVSFLTFIGLLIYGLSVDGNNKKDEMTGYILDVSNTKYLKIFSLAFCYVILIFLSYFTWMLSLAYLDMEFMTSIFQFMFYALAIATLPLFIIFVYILIANKVRDSKISEALSRGLRIK